MSDRPKVFVSPPDPGRRARRRSSPRATRDVWPDELPPPRDELLRRVSGCDGLLTLLTDRVDDELLDAAGPQLKVVSNYAVGFDNIDVPACTRRGIPVGNTPGVLTDTTADLAFALLMAAARRCSRATATSARAAGRRGARCCSSGRTSTARRSASSGSGGSGRRWRGARGLRHDGPVPRRPALPADGHRGRARRDVSWRSTTCSAGADFVTLHVNLTDETRHLINAERLRG